MQLVILLALLVCVGHTIAQTMCATCEHTIKMLPFQGKCYRANALGNAGVSETTCAYEEKNLAPMGFTCTYDEKGHIIRSDSTGACIENVPVDSTDCPPCLF